MVIAQKAARSNAQQGGKKENGDDDGKGSNVQKRERLAARAAARRILTVPFDDLVTSGETFETLMRDKIAPFLGFRDGKDLYRTAKVAQRKIRWRVEGIDGNTNLSPRQQRVVDDLLLLDPDSFSHLILDSVED